MTLKKAKIPSKQRNICHQEEDVLYPHDSTVDGHEVSLEEFVIMWDNYKWEKQNTKVYMSV